MKRLNVILNDDLHTKLKLTAFTQGITISQYVIDLLNRELNKKENRGEK